MRLKNSTSMDFTLEDIITELAPLVTVGIDLPTDLEDVTSDLMLKLVVTSSDKVGKLRVLSAKLEYLRFHYLAQKIDQKRAYDTQYGLILDSVLVRKAKDAPSRKALAVSMTNEKCDFSYENSLGEVDQWIAYIGEIIKSAEVSRYAVQDIATIFDAYLRSS